MESYLVVGLGNAGVEYEGTRHNVGFRIVEALAEEKKCAFRPALRQAKGHLAQANIGEEVLYLLMPLTYMNESGFAVRKCLDYFDIPLRHCLIVVDDADLPFGSLRMREKGSSGGHNGLKSVAAYLGEEYARLRIGIGRKKEEPLSEYVLSRFSLEEEKELPKIIQRALVLINSWLKRELQLGEQNA